MKYVMLLIAFFMPAAVIANGDAGLDPVVEIDKTNRFIEFEVSFENPPVKANFKAQDGAMVSYNVDGAPTIKFIVKKYGDGDIKLHIVKDAEFFIDGKKRKALAIQPGIDLLKPVSLDALHAQGIKSLTYKTDFPFTPISVERTATLQAAGTVTQ